MPTNGQERSAYHGVCTSTKRPYQGQNKSSVKSDKTAADFLFTCRSSGIPFYLFMRKPIGSSIAAILMVTIMLPFFFMAMYEKTDFPLKSGGKYHSTEVYLSGSKTYKTENFYQEISTLVKKEGVPDGKKDKAGGSAGASVPGGKKKPSGKKKQKKQKRKRTGKA